MSDVLKAQRLELVVRIPEQDLLEYLLGRYNQEEMAELGITPGASVIRSMEIDPEGVARFQVAAVTFRDAVGVVKALTDREQAEQEALAKEKLAEATEESKGFSESNTTNSGSSGVVGEATEGGCPKADQMVKRIRKRAASRKAAKEQSNSV